MSTEPNQPTDAKGEPLTEAVQPLNRHDPPRQSIPLFRSDQNAESDREETTDRPQTREAEIDAAPRASLETEAPVNSETTRSTDDFGRTKTAAAGESAEDGRLYVIDPANWQTQLKIGWEREYCYAKNPGEDYFHLLLHGEMYVTRDTEKFCLSCALRRGIVTTERLHWQKPSSIPQ